MRYGRIGREEAGNRSSIRHRLLGAGVTIPADYQPRRVVDGGPLAIPHALRGGFRDFVGLARHWILAIVDFGLTATTVAVQAPLTGVPTATERPGYSHQISGPGIEDRTDRAPLRQPR
jgi:hypothetical protein